MSNRHKYIRFFISSTFADMTKERDMLQQLLSRISQEYMAKDWQIEMIDLRWGISKEAGLENKTMQICKEELRRCQLLSPRPNFIILLGNRYGWLPLPERIARMDAQQLQMKEEEKRLFDDWYKLDENYLPVGEYVLQRRMPPYDDVDKWEQEVEQPLSRMFLRNERTLSSIWNIFKPERHQQCLQLYGKSATEQEIEMGALSVADATEHVIAYFRNMSGIPQELQKTFYEEDKQARKSLLNLQKQIRQKLSTENIYEENLSYTSYQSKEHEKRFVEEMEKRLRHVINASIEQYEQLGGIDENEEHLQFAYEEASHFVGREDLLKEIHQYIEDPNEHRPLWIKAHSGWGKSALMAKIIADHLKSHHIICRFCGLTNHSMDEVTMFRDLYEMLPHHGKMPDYSAPRYHFGHALEKFHPTQPTLVVLDALNQLETQGFGFENFTWLKPDGNVKIKHEYHPNLKIIVSSTDELRFTKEPPFLKVIHLSNMEGDAESLVLDIVRHHGRRLSSIQEIALRQIIASSDCSALYLRMLGYYLATVPSWVEITQVPSGLDGLVALMIDELSQPERHGKELVRVTLNLFVTERVGLTDEEVQQLLSSDRQLVDSLEKNSFHALDLSGERLLPNILWSRLRHDLSPFLRSFVSVGGQMSAIFHTGLQHVIRKYLRECYIEDELNTLNTLQGDAHSSIENSIFRIRHGVQMMPWETSARKLMFDYYSKKAVRGNKHALLEVIHSACDYNAPFVSEAIEFLKMHFNFLLTKYHYFPKELIQDFDELIKKTKDEERKELFELRSSISTLPQKVEEEQLLLYMMSQPTDSILYQLAGQTMSYDHVMENGLANSGPKDTSIYTLSEIGELPCMSEDGTKVASLFENRHEVRIEDVKEAWRQKKVMTFKEEVLDMACSEDLSRLLIQTGDVYTVYVVSSRQPIISCRLTERPWVSLSADGLLFACGDVRGTWVYDLSLGAKAQLKASCKSMFAGQLTPSGSYLWLLQEDRTLYRIPLRNISNYGSWDVNSASAEGPHKYNNGNPKDLMDLPYTYFPGLPFRDENRNLLDGNLTDTKQTTSGNIYKCRTAILNCSNHCCVCFHDSFAVHVIMGDNDRWYSSSKCFYANFIWQRTNYVQISNDERSIIYVSSPYSSIYSINNGEDFVIQCYIYPQCVNRDLTLALWDGRIFDLQEQMKRFVISEGNVGGLNSLSVSLRGDKAILSVGRNVGMERRLEVLRIKDKEMETWLPPFHNRDYLFVISSRVAPDGSFSVFSNQQHIRISPQSMELLVCFSEHDSVNISTGESGCLGLEISMDSQYVVAMRGDYIDWPKPIIYVLNKQGRLLLEKPTSFETKDGIRITYDNRYLIALYKGGYAVFDMVKEQPMEIRSRQSFPYESYEMDYELKHPFLVILPVPEQPILSSDVGNKKLFRVDLITREAYSIPNEMHLLAASPSGRLLYLTDDEHHLFMAYYPWDGTMTSLAEHVQVVIPALDEAHIYLLKDDFTIQLFNVKTKVVEQQAYNGKSYHQTVCAKGLYVVNTQGAIALFQPRKELNVNVPAVTTFVRRWNLETKEQEEPLAICPMCGGRIELSHTQQEVLITSADEIHFEDWDNPKLSGHECPHCRAALQYTPYII